MEKICKLWEKKSSGGGGTEAVLKSFFLLFLLRSYICRKRKKKVAYFGIVHFIGRILKFSTDDISFIGSCGHICAVHLWLADCSCPSEERFLKKTREKKNSIPWKNRKEKKLLFFVFFLWFNIYLHSYNYIAYIIRYGKNYIAYVIK